MWTPRGHGSSKTRDCARSGQAFRDGSERIIGWIASPDSSRLLVGQLAGARLEIEWMSVLLGYGQVLIYRDVNGDGIGEIWSLSAYFPAASKP